MARNPDEIMLDLETMGTDPNSAIIAIGAVIFTNGKVTEEFERNITLKSNIHTNAVIDPSTIIWWMKQNKEAREKITTAKTDLGTALVDFANWIPDNCLVWGNGSDFDNVVLSSAYKRIGAPTPWKYWNNRCYRTLKNIYHNVPMDRTGTQHSAVDDARNQAEHLIKMLY